MDCVVDETAKYLTNSSKKPKHVDKPKNNEHRGIGLVPNEHLETICFDSTSVHDGIPGMTGDYDDQIVVTLLPATPDANGSDKLNEDLSSETFAKLPTTTTGEIYLTSSYTSDDASHLPSSQNSNDMIYAELHINGDANSPDPDYAVMNFESVKVQPKRREKTEPRKLSNSKKAPLPASIEMMEDPVRNLWVTSKSHKKQLKECGHSWTTGMWSKEEIKILKDNIDKYCTKRGIKDPNDIIFRASKEDRRDFYPTISNGLNRPLFAVYRRVKRMYDQRNHKGRYTNEEVDKLKRLTKIHGRDWTTIARHLGRSSGSVKDRSRLLKEDSTSGKWTKLEEQRLASAVHSVTRTKHGNSVTDGIPWPAVADLVGTRTEKQCRSKWLNYLNWKMYSGTEWTKEDDRLLVQKIAARNPANENEINWTEISEGWSSVRSPSWLRKKWTNLKKILLDSGVGETSFTDTVKLLDKLFSEDIFRVWDKPKQLIRFLVGVQKARNAAEAPRKKLAAKKKKTTSSSPPPSVNATSSSTAVFSDGADRLITSDVITSDESSCVTMSQESLNSIVRPRSGSESAPQKSDFDLPSSSTAELVCEANEEGVLSLPQGTYQLTPTSSEGVYIIESAEPSSNEGVTLPDSMGRVVNITVNPEILKSVLEEQESSVLSFTGDVDQEYLTETPSSSGDNPVLSSVASDVIVNSIESDDDVSIYVT